jgi:prevent-host-death family protein
MGDPQVSIRELRNHGGEVIARVQAGESLTVTHSGLPVARIVPIAPPALSSEVLVAAWRRLPRIDLDELRRDIDGLIDPALPALPDEDADVSGIDGLDVREVRLVKN